MSIIRQHFAVSVLPVAIALVLVARVAVCQAPPPSITAPGVSAVGQAAPQARPAARAAVGQAKKTGVDPAKKSTRNKAYRGRDPFWPVGVVFGGVDQPADG